MNADQKQHVAMLQDSSANVGLYLLKNKSIYVGFKRTAIRSFNITRSCRPQRYFEISDDKLKVLKNKYPNFSLIHSWEYKIKTNANAGNFLIGEWFVGDIIANTEYRKREMNLRCFVYTDKNVEENFSKFLSSNSEISNKKNTCKASSNNESSTQ